jgi:hypothetical protein
MPCPYFLPSRPLDGPAWIQPPRLPLGDAYAGTCLAHPAEVVEPAEARLRELCNCGYARGRCQRFPHDSAGDAVRFSVTDNKNGQVRVVYIVEREHVPVEHGVLEFAGEEMRAGGRISELLARQARVFVESYLRRRVN